MPGGGLARVAVPRARMSVARPIRGGPAPAATAKASSGGAWLKNLWQKRIKRNMSRALAAVNSRAGGPQDTRDGGAPRASPLPVGVVPPAPRTGVKRGTHPKLPQARRGRLTLKAASHTKAAETLPDGMGVPAGAGPGPGPRDQPRRRVKRSRATEIETHAERKRAKAISAVEGLLDSLPAFFVSPQGAERPTQVTSHERRRLLRKLMLDKAGPKGEAAKKGARAWRLFASEVVRRNLPKAGLPASAELIAQVVSAELERSCREAKGTRGGRTTGRTIRQGFEYLAEIGLPFKCVTDPFPSPAPLISPLVGARKTPLREPDVPIVRCMYVCSTAAGVPSVCRQPSVTTHPPHRP